MVRSKLDPALLTKRHIYALLHNSQYNSRLYFQLAYANIFSLLQSSRSNLKIINATLVIFLQCNNCCAAIPFIARFRQCFGSGFNFGKMWIRIRILRLERNADLIFLWKFNPRQINIYRLSYLWIERLHRI